VLFSSGLPAGGRGILNISLEIAVIYNIHTYFQGFFGQILKAKADQGWDEVFPSL
jgi:hypothetical protein